jgi:nucleoside 2-deoxyribosyltransferase
MTASPTAPDVTDCPAWCGANHSAGAIFHAHCAGEVQWTESSLAVEVNRCGDGDLVELGYHVDHGAPAIAFLNNADVRRLRDCLTNVLGALDAA